MGGCPQPTGGEEGRGVEVRLSAAVVLCRLRGLTSAVTQIPLAHLLAVRGQRGPAPSTRRSSGQNVRRERFAARCELNARELTRSPVQLGLLAEIKELWALAHAESAGETDYSRGIYQAIGRSSHVSGSSAAADTTQAGYKEFEPYLSSRAGAADDATHDAATDPLFKAGLGRMKISTRQYAKRQVKWIQQRLLPAVRKLEEQDVTVVLLDATGEHCRRVDIACS